MNWYLKAIRQYADFSGRARRKEYWMFALFNFIFLLIAVMLDMALGLGYGDGPGVLYLLYLLFMIIPSLSVGVRRLHDTGKSGWFMLIGFIPAVGGIILFIFYVMEGNSGPNEYGDDPKEGEFV